jgi:transcriptional regulator with XRE-family HTH domain
MLKTARSFLLKALADFYEGFHKGGFCSAGPKGCRAPKLHLATDLGITPQALSDLLQGEYFPSDEITERMVQLCEKWWGKPKDYLELTVLSFEEDEKEVLWLWLNAESFGVHSLFQLITPEKREKHLLNILKETLSLFFESLLEFYESGSELEEIDSGEGGEGR